jgi:hypothetical protein
VHSVCFVDLAVDVVEDRPLPGSPVRFEHGVDAASRDNGLRKPRDQVLKDRRASAVVLEDFGEKAGVYAQAT